MSTELRNKVAVGICTAPRKRNTLSECVASLSNAGFSGNLVISSDDRSKDISSIYSYEFNLTYHVNGDPLGCFKNHHKLLELLVHQDKEYIMLLQDDFVYHKNIFKILEKTDLKEDFGYYNLYTYRVYQNAIKRRGWNRLNIGRATAYAVSYFMKTETVKKIMEHDFYQNHLHNYTKNQQVDACISEVCRVLQLPMYVHNPSLAIHIGHDCSTLNHGHAPDTEFRSFPV